MRHEPSRLAIQDADVLDQSERPLAERADFVAVVAEEWAGHVDREARFPNEAFAAAKVQRLMGIMVPRELGGEGKRLRDVTDICYRLARSCSSTAMIYAMHQCCVACLVSHGGESDWHRALLRRIADEQLLLASSTTEGQNGGNLRLSAAPAEHCGAGISLERAATVVSYGAQADGIVTTARRSAESAPTDQVLIAFCKDDYSLTPLAGWDSLGMRGTCSSGFTLRATGAEAQIFPDPYERIHAKTMVPVHHLAWSSVWAGIAAGAVERAKDFVRHAARKASGALPPGAAQLTEARATLEKLRALVTSSLRAFEDRTDDEPALRSLEFQVLINLTKVEASELALAAVMMAGRTCGLSGYRNDSEFSIGRHLRDILSAPIMISNDRIRTNIASASVMAGIPAGLYD